MAQTVTVDEMAKALTKELTEWSEEVSEGVKEDVKKVSDETRDEIKSNSPQDKRNVKRKGRYAKGWSNKVSYEDATNIRVTVYNKTDYQLAHLLEYGHEVVRGGKAVGRAEAHPHIRPAEQHAEEKLLNKVKVRVRKG